MERTRLQAINVYLKAIGAHCLVVLSSFILSFAVVSGADLFSPGGEAIDAAVCGLLFTHLLALFVGLCFSRVSKASCLVVFLIAFSCAGCLGLEGIQRWHYRRYRAVYDMFRDDVADPIPASVSDLRFVGLDDGISPGLMFRFDIDRVDLDAILTRLALSRVEPGAMLDPTDFFQYPYYLPLEGEFEVYQGKGALGEVLTIKTNKARTHAIFRRQSSGYYRDRDWENRNPALREMDERALSAMKERYERGRSGKSQ